MSQTSDPMMTAPGSLALSSAFHRALAAAFATAPAMALPRLCRFLAAKLRAWHVHWRRERFAHATRCTLRALDDRTLHDLGFDRSEISGYPDPTRRHALVDPFARSGG